MVLVNINRYQQCIRRHRKLRLYILHTNLQLALSLCKKTQDIRCPHRQAYKTVQ